MYQECPVPGATIILEVFDPELPPGAIDVANMKDNGIMKVILTPGESAETPKYGDTVVVHYTGTLWGGEKHGQKFDSSRDRDTPFEFKLGEGQVIQGWDQGVASMTKGEKSDLYIVAKYAYGASGSGESIPPNATLKFEVELLYWKGEDLSPESNGSICRVIVNKGTAYQTPNEGAAVDLHIKFYKPPGSEEIESEKDFKYDLGDGFDCGVPKGVDIALKKMKKQEISRLILKSPYSLNNIPEQVVDVELKNFEKMKDSWELHGAEEKLAQSELLKAKGTDFFKKNKFAMAQVYYKKAADYLEQDSDFKDGGAKADSCGSCDEDEDDEGGQKHHKKHSKKPEVEKPPTAAVEENGVGGGVSNLEKRRVLLVAVHNNLSLCYLKQQNYVECIKSCDKAVEFDPNSEKGYFRRGQANLAINEYEIAKSDFVKTLKIDPSSKTAQTHLATCLEKIKEQNEIDKKKFYGMFDKFAKQDATKEPAVETKSKTASSEETNNEETVAPMETNTGDGIASNV